MKTEPTDIDREAATLFTPAPGMRTWQAADACTIGPRRVIEAEASGAEWIAIRTEGGWSWLPVCALDTDDPATVGCMLAQVEDAAGTDDVSVEKLRPYGRGFAVFIRGSYSHAPGPTRGAALVAAMRALKSTPTR